MARSIWDLKEALAESEDTYSEFPNRLQSLLTPPQVKRSTRTIVLKMDDVFTKDDLGDLIKDGVLKALNEYQPSFDEYTTTMTAKTSGDSDSDIVDDYKEGRVPGVLRGAQEMSRSIRLARVQGNAQGIGIGAMLLSLSLWALGELHLVWAIVGSLGGAMLVGLATFMRWEEQL